MDAFPMEFRLCRRMQIEDQAGHYFSGSALHFWCSIFGVPILKLFLDALESPGSCDQIGSAADAGHP